MPRPSGEDPNCMGTLLHWLGERDQDGFAESDDIITLLKEKYELTKTPTEGDIAIWYKDPFDILMPLILHTGVVIEEGTPPKIKSRMTQDGDIEELPADVVMGMLDRMRKYKSEGYILTDAMQRLRIVHGALPKYYTRISGYK